MKYHLRDIIWLITLSAIAMAWACHHIVVARATEEEIARILTDLKEVKEARGAWEAKAQVLADILRDDGYDVDIEHEGVSAIAPSRP